MEDADLRGFLQITKQNVTRHYNVELDGGASCVLALVRRSIGGLFKG